MNMKNNKKQVIPIKHKDQNPWIRSTNTLNPDSLKSRFLENLESCLTKKNSSFVSFAIRVVRQISPPKIPPGRIQFAAIDSKYTEMNILFDTFSPTALDRLSHLRAHSKLAIAQNITAIKNVKPFISNIIRCNKLVSN